jgi:hypothetical protein
MVVFRVANFASFPKKRNGLPEPYPEGRETSRRAPAGRNPRAPPPLRDNDPV